MEKRKKVKRSQKKVQHCFSFTQNTSTLCRCIQNLRTLALLGAKKSVMKIFIGEKEKERQIKGMRLLIISYKKSYPMFIRNFKILGAVVPEKSLTKNFIGEK